MPFRHIACCVDDSPATAAVLAQARELWGAGQGRLSLVHVAPHPLLVDTVDGETVVSPRDINATEHAWLDARAGELPGAKPVLLEGLAGPEICRWAAGAGVDLLVAARHHGTWETAVCGSVTRHLVDHAPCAVLVVRPAPAPVSGASATAEGARA